MDVIANECEAIPGPDLAFMSDVMKGTYVESTGAVAYANHVAPGQAQHDRLPRRSAPRNDMIATWYYKR